MNGAELITQERKRQIEKEGFDAEHDRQNTNQELALAACYYALPFFVTYPRHQISYHCIPGFKAGVVISPLLFFPSTWSD
jgi:hypothetical protein